MTVWELFYDGLDDYAGLVPVEMGLELLDIIGADGRPKQWVTRPKVAPYIEKRKKKAKPRADFSYLIGGSIVLNEKAYLAMQDFLLPFGQLLELDCNGEVEYFYNVTNILPCVDYERSVKKGTSVVEEVFLDNVIPEEPMIFKDLLTAGTRTYANQAGREKFEQLAAAAGLFGACFVEAGKEPIAQLKARKAAVAQA